MRSDLEVSKAEFERALMKLERSPAGSFLLQKEDTERARTGAYQILLLGLEVFFAKGEFRIPKPWNVLLFIKMIRFLAWAVKLIVELVNRADIEEPKPKRQRRKRLDRGALKQDPQPIINPAQNPDAV